MIRNRRDSAGHLRQASDCTLLELISGGSVPAFAALVDRTVEAARAQLKSFPDGARFAPILASSYVEVWWLARFHREPAVDATSWITGIVRRRAGEALRGVDAGPRPSYSELEMASLLRRPVGDLLEA